MRTSPLRLAVYVLAVALGLVFAAPNLLTKEQASHLPGFLPSQQVSLGLDLRGGSHLVLEVDTAALVRERVQDLADRARDVLRRAAISPPAIASTDRFVDVQLADASQKPAALRALKQASALGPEIDSNQASLQTPGPEHIRIALNEAGIRDKVNAAAEQSLEIVRRRIDQIGVAEPTIQRMGSDRILVQLPGVQDPGHIRTLLGSTAKLSFHMLTESLVGARLLPGADDGQYRIQSRIAMSGDRLKDARMGFDERTNRPVINFRLDSKGTKQFSDITRANVGRPFAIVLDGKVLSAPVINEHIGGGSGQISGQFTSDEANDLAALLRAGALPAPLTVIEERTVGPDLGSDAIASGVATGLAGFVLVALFMLLLYGGWGLLANLALMLNVVLTLAVLTALGATLTLPGIAGMVLSIGLAVDANVLINERIREESRKGIGAMAALDRGFRRAYSTIIDSNLTALIATSLLFYFGSGPVRGFAVTMGLGIAISLFTAVAVVRAIMAAIVRRRRLSSIRIAPLLPRLIPDGTAIPFMRARFLGIAMSALLSLASIGLFFAPGLNYGIDFKGGIQTQVALSSPIALENVRGSLDRLGLGEISLQEFGDSSRLLIRAERQPGSEKDQTAALEKIRAAMRSLDQGVTFESSEVVGPKVSGELASAGLLAVFLASLAMLAYIWFRFEWHFAVGAIATLVLDVTKTVGFFALTGLEFNLTAIAALLTLIGYSVNDKVVVYDRMRENMRLFKSMPLRELIDRSINETLARSLYTSVTAFLAILPMAIWGGSAVSSFAIPMAFGIAIAASSSVFIAAPILLFLGDWRKSRTQRAAAPAEALARA